MTRITMLIVLVATVAGSLAGQITESQARKQLKKDLAEDLKAFKTDLKLEKAAALAAIKIFQDNVKAGNYSVGEVGDLVDALSDFLGDVTTAVQQTGNDAATAASGLLAQLALSEGGLNGILPDGFYAGDGGALDRHFAKILRARDKTVSAVAKKLSKLPKTVEKKAGVGMTTHLGLAVQPHVFSFDENLAAGFSFELPACIDLAIGVSSLGLANDGTMFLGGLGDAGAEDISVSVRVGNVGIDTFGGGPVGGDDRWSVLYDDAGNGLPEGAWMAQATQGVSSPTDSVPVGIR